MRMREFGRWTRYIRVGSNSPRLEFATRHGLGGKGNWIDQTTEIGYVTRGGTSGLDIGQRKERDHVMGKYVLFGLLFAAVLSLAGCERSDHVIVQRDSYGRLSECLILMNVLSDTYEESRDGVKWDGASGNRFHVNGPYTSAQVAYGNWGDAWKQLGLTEEECRKIHEKDP